METKAEIKGLPLPKEKQIDILVDAIRLVNSGSYEMVTAICHPAGYFEFRLVSTNNRSDRNKSCDSIKEGN